MTRTEVMASSRPQKADAAPITKGSSKLVRRLAVLPVAFALTMALVLPTAALAEEGLSGYNNKPSTSTTPTTGTSPSKESSTPTKTTAPEKTSEPTTTTEPTTTAKKATSLPFTGFDLRWTIGLGGLLLAMGVSIVVAQRRQRRRDDRI